MSNYLLLFVSTSITVGTVLLLEWISGLGSSIALIILFASSIVGFGYWNVAKLRQKSNLSVGDLLSKRQMMLVVAVCGVAAGSLAMLLFTTIVL